MIKKEYIKPSITVVHLTHRQTLLSGSPASIDSVTTDGTEIDSEDDFG